MVLRTPNFASREAQAKYLRELGIAIDVPGAPPIAIDRVRIDEVTLACCKSAGANTEACDATCTATEVDGVRDAPKYFDDKALVVGAARFTSARSLVGSISGALFEHGTTITAERPNEEDIECDSEVMRACNEDGGIVIIRGSDCSCWTPPDADATGKLADGLDRREDTIDDIAAAIKKLPAADRRMLLRELQDLADQTLAEATRSECAADDCASTDGCTDAAVAIGASAKELAVNIDRIVGSAAAASAEAAGEEESSNGSSGTALAAGIAAAVGAAVIAVLAAVLIVQRKRRAAANLPADPEFAPFEHRTSDVRGSTQ